MKNGQIILTAEDGSEEYFYVLEKAEIAGGVYLLVLDSPEEENAEALILKQIQDGEIVTYEILEDEDELKIISKYFEEILEDINLEME